MFNEHNIYSPALINWLLYWSDSFFPLSIPSLTLLLFQLSFLFWQCFCFVSVSRTHSMNRVDKTEAYLSNLPSEHQKMMIKYRDHLFRIRNCIGKHILERILIYQRVERTQNSFEKWNFLVMEIAKESILLVEWSLFKTKLLLLVEESNFWWETLILTKNSGFWHKMLNFQW